jgi:hypothetical protein
MIMKKLILITLACLLFSNIGVAQKFDIRAYGGFNALQLTSDEGETLINGVAHEQTVSGRLGAQFGFSATFGARFFVQPGFQRAILSTKIINKNSINGLELIDQTNIRVVSVPLKVGFRLIDPEDVNFVNVRVFGGFDGSHVTSVKHSKKSDGLEEIDANDFSNLILNADFGLGIDVLFLYLDLGYQLGITPVYTGGDSAKSNAFYGNLGIRKSF